MDEVIFYSSLGCPYCDNVKKFFTKFDIVFEERNVSLHKQYFEEIRERKIYGTPATLVNGELILGFQEKKLRQALNIT